MKSLLLFIVFGLFLHPPSVHADDGNMMSFFVGANHSTPTKGFGGVQNFLGLHVQLPLNEQWIGQILLQADSLGSSDGIEIRKGSYMFGLGRRYEDFYFFASLGVIDTMVINKAQRDSGGYSYNPITGASLPNQGVTHEDRYGYHLSVRRPFLFSRFGPFLQNAFSISPYFSYAGIFGSDPYGPVASLGVSFDLWIP